MNIRAALIAAALAVAATAASAMPLPPVAAGATTSLAEPVAHRHGFYRAHGV